MKFTDSQKDFILDSLAREIIKKENHINIGQIKPRKKTTYTLKKV